MSLSNKDMQEEFVKAIDGDNRDFLSKFRREILAAVKDKTDIQSDFARSIPELPNEEKEKSILQAELSKEERQKAKQQEQDVKVKVSQGQNQEQIMGQLTEEELDKVNEDTGLTKRQELLKTIYEQAIEERHKLRENIYVRQIKDGNISMEDHNYRKLLMYDMYICKVDLKFKVGTGKYISEEDRDIAKQEEKLMYKEAKSEDRLTDDHEKAVAIIRDINEALSDKAEKILQVIDNMEHGNIEESMKDYNALTEEYMELNQELEVLTPSLKELVAQEEKQDGQDKITSYNMKDYDSMKNKKNQVGIETINKEKATDLESDRVTIGATDQSKSIEEVNKELAEAELEKAKEILEDNPACKASIDAANELVESADEKLDLNVDITGEEKTNKLIQDDEHTDTNAEHKKEVSDNPDKHSNFELYNVRSINTLEEANENQQKREAENVKDKIKAVEKEI